MIGKAPNPKSLLAVLRGALDRRVKQRGRDTVVENAVNDPVKPLVQRVVEPDACDHCKSLGNSKPVDPRKVASEYHQYCKCHIKLVFSKAINAAKSIIQDYKAKVLVRSVDTFAKKSNIAISIIRINESSGKRPDYSLLSKKQIKRLTKEEVYGHTALGRAGLEPQALPEDRSASANIDLLMTVYGNRCYWELKSPNKGISAQKRLTTEGVSKWQRIRGGKKPECVEMEALGSPKITIDNRIGDASDTDALIQLITDMDYYSADGFDEAMLLAKGGFVLHLAK